MVTNLTHALGEFTKMHDDFLSQWNLALKTGDAALLDRMADSYYVTFFTRDQEKPHIFSYDESINGMQQSVTRFLGAEKRFENKVIRLRNAKNAVVFYEQSLVNKGEEVSRFFTIENWQYRDGNWEIVRETMEQI